MLRMTSPWDGVKAFGVYFAIGTICRLVKETFTPSMLEDFGWVLLNIAIAAVWNALWLWWMRKLDPRFLAMSAIAGVVLVVRAALGWS
jgi:hypothetical protein